MSQWNLDDALWNQMYIRLFKEKALHVRDEIAVRSFVETVVDVLRTGVAWKDSHPDTLKTDSIYHRFRRWAKRGVWYRLFLGILHDMLPRLRPKPVAIDATICKAHRSASGPRGRKPQSEGLGRSRGGLTTKIHAAVATTGIILGLRLTPGQAADCLQLPVLLRDISGMSTTHILADRAYAGAPCRAAIADIGAEAVVPSKKNCRAPIPYNQALYKERNVIERTFCRMKDAMRITTRRDKTLASYMSFVYLGALILNARVAERSR